MTTSRRCWWWKLGLASWLAMGEAIATSGNCVKAQITPDGTLAAESSVVTPTNIDGRSTEQIDGGATRGANLFHSFKQFSVPTGGGAYFNNALDIQNIISRVTGSSISNIDGLLRANGTANLFLLNPNGIIFGPNASLNIGGSFLGSTASSLNFADGTDFNATAPQTTPLLTVSVPIGLQYGGTAGSIRNQSRVTNSSEYPGGLQVLQGKTLALIGGDVSLDGGVLTAPGSRVELGGVAGVGTVGLNVDGSNLSLSYPASVQRADVSLTNGAEVDVAAGGGGSIAVNARNLDILGGSRLFAGIVSGQGSVTSQAGDITLNATGTITVAENNNGRGGIDNSVYPGAVGKGGNINIQARSLAVNDGALVEASTLGQGDAGSVNINARNTVSLDGASQVLSRVYPGAVGNSGGINVTTGSLSVTDGAFLSTSTFGQGNAGSVLVQAQDSVALAGNQTTIFSSVESGGVGNGGEINIQAGSLSLMDGAQLAAFVREASEDGTLPAGRGNAGNVNIDVSDAVTIAGVSNGFPSGVRSTVGLEAIGNGGDITIKSGALSVTDGAALTASTLGQGDAGSVTITATDTVSFDGVGNDGGASGAFSLVESEAVGNGGSVNITTGSLSVTNGALLSASTLGQGNAGSVTITATDTVSFDGVGSNGRSSGAFSLVESEAVGNGGSVNITTGSLSVTNGALLSASTLGQGNAGSVRITTGSLSVTNDAQLLSSTFKQGDAGIVTINARDTVSFDRGAAALSSVDAGAVGNGGSVNITTGSLSLTNGAELLAYTSGWGNAGSVTINARDTVSFDGVGSNGLSSGVINTVDLGAEGNGGNINITTGSLVLTNGALLQASTLGQGNAGSVTINARDTVSFDGVDSDGFVSGVASQVTPRAFGNGGDIKITAESLSLTDGAGLSASSEGNGAAGNIEVAVDSIRVSNQAFLSSNTTGGQGSIFLRSGNLVLRRGSNITTNATGTATGGNITIDTGVIAALENSDIRANAQEGFGGRVIINAQGIFGTEFRNQQTPESDITASSNLGPEFSGTVEINTPDIDPSQGLAALPAELVDASVLIASSRCGVSGRQDESKFIVTGRGGLPLRPGDAAPSPYPTGSVRSIPSTSSSSETPRSSVSVSDPSTNPTGVSAPTPIVEAQGWVINNKGQVVLTAQAPNVTPHIPWMRSPTCHTPEPSS